MTTVEHAASARELLERHGRAIAEARSEGELLLGTLHRASSMANPPPFASAVALGPGGPRAIAAQVLGPRAHVLATGGAERITELAPALAAQTGELASVVGPTADVSVFADAWVAHTGCASRPARTRLAYELQAVEDIVNATNSQFDRLRVGRDLLRHIGERGVGVAGQR